MIEEITLNSGKKVEYEIGISPRGANIFVHASLNREERKEFRYEVGHEHDVAHIYFDNCYSSIS